MKTAAELIDYVAKTQGAIGFVSSDEVPDDMETKVRIIKIK